LRGSYGRGGGRSSIWAHCRGWHRRCRLTSQKKTKETKSFVVFAAFCQNHGLSGFLFTRGRNFVPGFGPRACPPRRYARASQRPRARYTSTHHSPPHMLASCASRRAFSALASFSSRLAPIFTAFSLLRNRGPGSRSPFPHRRHTGYSPYTHRVHTADNFRPPAAFGCPFGSHPLCNAP
jgi:hypothetical protein